MASLFAEAVSANGLFMKEGDTWVFDSTQCFASLNGDTFQLWRELGTIDEKNGRTLDHGQFLPFNTLTPGVFSVHHTNERDALDNELPEDNPRKGEALYLIEEANHYFGLTAEMTFLYPAEGEGGGEESEDRTASFTADDDLWVYIDGMLILDLGGIHSAIPGSVNFSTGTVTYRGKDGKDHTTKLSKLYEQRYREQHPEARSREIQAYLNEVFEENSHWQMVFKGDTVHTIKLIYLERGAGASNLSMRLHLDILPKE